MKTTRYFEERVMVKRPYLKRSWCEQALTDYEHHEVQPENGSIRYWIFVEELEKYLRVVTLSDGETVHNAFPDRNFKGKL